VVPLGEPGIATGPAAWGVRFATPEHGFVFGNGLWVTTDGGTHWSAAAYPGGSIVSLEIIDHQVLAVTMHSRVAGHASWALLRRPLAGGAWTRLVTQASAIGNIATQARVAAIIDGTSVLVTGDGGLTITRHAVPCTASPFPVPTSIAVQAPRGLALLCAGQGYTSQTDKTVYVSGDLGATWQLAGHPSSGGDGGVIAASAPGHLTIATTSAASWLYYSADNGKTWRTVVTYPDGGQGWNDLGFTTTHDGLVIHGHPYYGDMLGQLLLTQNGGLTWHAVDYEHPPEKIHVTASTNTVPAVTFTLNSRTMPSSYRTGQQDPTPSPGQVEFLGLSPAREVPDDRKPASATWQQARCGNAHDPPIRAAPAPLCLRPLPFVIRSSDSLQPRRKPPSGCGWY
jgi:photosystem II stability/assembly factor-like uncharacterized protein